MPPRIWCPGPSTPAPCTSGSGWSPRRSTAPGRSTIFDLHLTDTDHDAVALIFSGSRPLSAPEVSDASFRAMRDRPLEIDLPLSRGLLSKVTSAAPSVLLPLYGP